MEHGPSLFHFCPISGSHVHTHGVLLLQLHTMPTTLARKRARLSCNWEHIVIWFTLFSFSPSYSSWSSSEFSSPPFQCE